MDRRAFLGSLGLLAMPHAAEAQQATKVHRMGFLSLNLAAGDPRPREAFLQALRSLSYLEGRNLLIEYRDAGGKTEQLPALAAELVRLKVDVIVTTSGVGSTSAARQKTGTIPIVFLEAGDPVATGLVASLSRPGGNITGLTNISPELAGKRLQLLKEAVPTASRVAMLYNVSFPATRLGVQEAQIAAPALGLTLLPVEPRAADELDRMFAALSSLRADAMLAAGDPFTRANGRRIAELAARSRLPTLFGAREIVEAGGLLSYAVSLPDMYRRAAKPMWTES
jgi:putative tryptophan/tyrosine transport system substrate-binding protein